MSLMTICNGCAMGDHSKHYEVVQAVPEGMIGGARCRCMGECGDGRYESKEMMRIAKLMARASRRRGGAA